MSNYVCRFGLYHDKEVTDGNPSSNNGWIYTAYAKMLGLPIEYSNVRYTFERCLETNSVFQINRLPDKSEPPQSRDEIIGMVSLGFMNDGYFKMTRWLWLKNLDFFEAIPLHKQLKALWKLRREHRNYIWENKVYDAYPIAFKLFWHDRYYIKKMSRNNANAFEFTMFKLYEYGVKIKGTAGEKNLLYLQLNDLAMHDSTKRMKIGKTITEYFGKDHIFSEHVS